MSYIKEFSDMITVPEFLLSPPWEDVSWHNDMCPRFENHHIKLAVWVDYDKPADREYQEIWRKFTVVKLIPKTDGTYDTGDITLFQTEDADKLKAWIPMFLAKANLEDASFNLHQLDVPEPGLHDSLQTMIAELSEKMEELGEETCALCHEKVYEHGRAVDLETGAVFCTDSCLKEATDK